MLAILAALAAPAPESFRGLAKRLLPTVVNISTSQTLKAPPPSAVQPPDRPRTLEVIAWRTAARDRGRP